MLKGVTVSDGTFFHFHTVVADGIRTITEEFGYLRAAGNTEQDKGEDTHLDRQSFSGFGSDLCFGFKQGVEVLHERAVEGKEGIIEGAVEILHLALHEGGGIFLSRPARHSREAADIIVVHLQIAADILLFDFIGFLEFAVDGSQFLVHRFHLAVEDVETSVLMKAVDSDKHHGNKHDTQEK